MLANYSSHPLPGGLRLAHAQVHESECAALSIYIPVGSRDEVGKWPIGLAHFSEHMAFKGTTTRSAKELTLAIESEGGQANACTCEDHTVYEAVGEAELMPAMLEVLSDMVWRSNFPKHEIEMERDVIGEEITMIRESPSDHIGDMISAALWPEHALGNAISGSVESIKKIKRSTLQDFAQLHHFRTDIVVATSGPMSAEKIIEGLLPFLPENFHSAPERVPYSQSATRKLVETRPTEQLQLALGWLTGGRHAEGRHALRLLSLILGESSSSRLFTELREERGLCYQIGSEVSLFEETGALQIIAGLDPDSREESLETIYKEIKQLTEEGPRAGELERAKRLALAQSKLGFESTSAHAAWAGESLMFMGHIASPSEMRAKLMAVTAEEVQEMACQIFAQEAAMAEIRES